MLESAVLFVVGAAGAATDAIEQTLHADVKGWLQHLCPSLFKNVLHRLGIYCDACSFTS